MKNLEELEGECKLLIADELRQFGEKCYKAGIREVVEWVKEHRIPIMDGYSYDNVDGIDVDKWQAKLKEWGIDA